MKITDSDDLVAIIIALSSIMFGGVVVGASAVTDNLEDTETIAGLGLATTGLGIAGGLAEGGVKSKKKEGSDPVEPGVKVEASPPDAIGISMNNVEPYREPQMGLGGTEGMEPRFVEYKPGKQPLGFGQERK